MNNKDDSWFRFEAEGLKLALFIAAVLWCVCSGMYTLALVVRSLIG